ncbi:MAG: nuclear transport factor 2 family protein [Ilumatobacter sp.]|nr:nuclear transport factor 2 family protein [Ilumatobacter sp.]
MTRPQPEYFIRLEQQVWQALVDGDADADRRLLADGFLGVYPDGFAGRDEHVAQFANEPTVAHYSIDHPHWIALSDDAHLLCYEARFRRPGDDDLHRMYVSSLWQLVDDRWVNTFSQDTPAAT